MSIRRTVRKALESGTTMYAKVEEVNLGLATVRLGGTGRRMSNLSTVGGEVQKNDTVIVDWSAGINPIVRPLFLEDEPEELELGTSAPENTYDSEDISTFQDTYYGGFWGGNYPPLNQGVPHQLEGGSYDYEYESYYQEYFDSADICRNQAKFEDGYMYIPRDGKYLIGFNWLEPFNSQDEEPGSPTYPAPMESSCYYRIRILKNDTTVLGEGTGQWDIGWYGETSINLTAFDYLNEGDRLSFEVYFTSSAVSYYLFDYHGHFDGDGRTRWCIYLPGT